MWPTRSPEHRLKGGGASTCAVLRTPGLGPGRSGIHEGAIMSKAVGKALERRKATHSGDRRIADKTAKIRGCVAVGIIAVSLCGCSGETSQADDVAASPTETAAPDWKTLPDGSRGHFVYHENGSGQAERCWQVEGRWDCLGVNMLGRSDSSNESAEIDAMADLGGPMFFAKRVLKRRLNDPFPYADEADPIGGYRCYTAGGGFLNETIFAGSKNGDTTLLSNDSAPLEPYGGYPWSADFVNKFMQDNGVSVDRPYWNCFHVERLIASGSLATLVTTALTYEELIGPVSAEAP